MVNSYDWKIHKKLLDGGGLGPVVYIIPARGNGKIETERERIAELIASGRTVVYGRVDRDMLTPERYERAERILQEFLKGERNER